MTNAHYARFIEAKAYKEPFYWRDRRFSDPEQPVVAVSWHDARAFCAWLSEGGSVVYDLPSEAQWEYAARGPDSPPYPWGDAPPTPERACYGLSWEQDKPATVGRYPEGRGPFGTLDQAGLVWEWCLDQWDPEAYRRRENSDVLDPVRLTTSHDDPRSLRGGSWSSPASALAAGYRFWNLATNRGVFIGFRVARAPASPLKA